MDINLIVIYVLLVVGFYFFGTYVIKNIDKEKKKKYKNYKNKNYKNYKNYEDFFDRVIDIIKKDFEKDPYFDKMSVSEDENEYKYTTLNGETITLYYSSMPLLRIKTNNYSKTKNITLIQTKEYIHILLELIKKGKHRNNTKINQNIKNDFEKSKVFTDAYLKDKKLYEKLSRIQTLRKEQLKSMDKNNPNINILKNELLVVEEKIKQIKEKINIK